MLNWIYEHLINTIWFISFVMAFFPIAMVIILRSGSKKTKNHDNQSNKGTQEQSDPTS